MGEGVQSLLLQPWGRKERILSVQLFQSLRKVSGEKLSNIKREREKCK